MKEKGKLIVFSAPSGSGKTTIVRELMKFPELNLAFSVSATSREKRPGEQHGMHYYFISPAEFKKKIRENAFVEWEEVYPGHFYGTLKNEVERLLNEGKNVIFDIDVKGGMNIKRFYPGRTMSVFVQVPGLDELKKRLKERNTETEEKINLRLSKAREEWQFAPQFDVILMNADLPVAIKEAYRLVKDFLHEKE
jgi:guanylate kinase